MTLVSYANNIGSDVEFILMRRRRVCITNNKDPRIDPWRTLYFIIAQPEKIF